MRKHWLRLRGWYIYIYADIFFSVLVLVGSPRTFASSLPPEEMVRYMVISFKVSGPRRDQGEQARHAASIETERASVVLDVWRKGEQGANTQTQKSKHLNWEQLWTWTLSSCPRRTKQRPHVQKNTAVRSMFENLNLNICVTLTRKNTAIQLQHFGLLTSHKIWPHVAVWRGARREADGEGLGQRAFLVNIHKHLWAGVAQ